MNWYLTLVAAVMAIVAASINETAIAENNADVHAGTNDAPLTETLPISALSLGDTGHPVDDCCCEPRGLLGGLIKPSNMSFSNFISPITNPVFFEDPRIQTEARFLFLHQKIPHAAQGGDVQLYAMQLQAALTDRLSIVADKDGFLVSNNPLLDDGWADVAVGVKYNLYADCHLQRLLSAGVSYELPVGSTRSLQGNGDGEFHLYLTGGAEFRCDWHWVSTTGFRLPADTSDESQVWYWSNHIDRRVTDSLYVLAEANWYHWMRSGTNPALAGVEGVDLINLGSTGVAGNDIVTGAVGVKYKPNVHNEIGIAYEIPLTDRRDVLDNRLTVDWIIRY